MGRSVQGGVEERKNTGRNNRQKETRSKKGKGPNECVRTTKKQRESKQRGRDEERFSGDKAASISERATGDKGGETCKWRGTGVMLQGQR